MLDCATICAGKLGGDDRVIVEQNSRTMLEMTLDKYNVGVRWDAESQRLYDALVGQRRDAALKMQVLLVEIASLSFLACLATHSREVPEDIKHYAFLLPSEVSTDFHDGVRNTYHHIVSESIFCPGPVALQTRTQVHQLNKDLWQRANCCNWNDPPCCVCRLRVCTHMSVSTRCWPRFRTVISFHTGESTIVERFKQNCWLN